jgi:outer membrane protein assembly factor BamB
MRVTNGIPVGCSLLLPVDCTVKKFVQTLKATNGSLLWNYTVGTQSGIASGIDTSAVMSPDDKVVYFGAGDGRVHAISRAKGEFVWSFATGGPVLSSPALSKDGSVLFIGSNDKSVYGLNTNNGTVRWSTPVGGQISDSSPALSPDGSILYIGGLENKMAAIDSGAGTVLWSYETPFCSQGRPCKGWVESSPAVSPDGRTVYFGSWDNSMYAVHA